jgi:phosphoribosylformylglycinamidine (FGAM) synthase-like amidotransferase family enzyme
MHHASKPRFGIVVFPGSNCGHDCYYVLKKILNQDVRFMWHKDSSIQDVDVIVLPGGFLYGDYLRCGAIAHFSPIMKAVNEFEKKRIYSRDLQRLSDFV